MARGVTCSSRSPARWSGPRAVTMILLRRAPMPMPASSSAMPIDPVRGLEDEEELPIAEMLGESSDRAPREPANGQAEDRPQLRRDVGGAGRTWRGRDGTRRRRTVRASRAPPGARSGSCRCPRAGERHERCLLDEAHQRGDLVLPVDERGQLDRQVRGSCFEGPQGGNRLGNPTTSSCHSRSTPTSLSRWRPRSCHAVSRRFRVGRLRLRRVRHEDLAAVPGRGDASRAIDLDADVVAGRRHRVPGVDTDPDPDLGVRRPADGRPGHAGSTPPPGSPASRSGRR